MRMGIRSRQLKRTGLFDEAQRRTRIRAGRDAQPPIAIATSSSPNSRLEIQRQANTGQEVTRPPIKSSRGTGFGAGGAVFTIRDPIRRSRPSS
jgi:hypothetical protein